jgi:hypothetical protein
MDATPRFDQGSQPPEMNPGLVEVANFKLRVTMVSNPSTLQGFGGRNVILRLRLRGTPQRLSLHRRQLRDSLGSDEV